MTVPISFVQKLRRTEQPCGRSCSQLRVLLGVLFLFLLKTMMVCIVLFHFHFIVTAKCPGYTKIFFFFVFVKDDFGRGLNALPEPLRELLDAPLMIDDLVESAEVIPEEISVPIAGKFTSIFFDT